MTDLPLSSRVTAPAVLELPADTPAVSWRSATMADVDGIYACGLEISASDHPHYVEPRDEIVDDFEHSYVDLERDTILALAPDGSVLGWGLSLVPPGQATLVRSILLGGVRPSARGRGIGRQMLGWQVARGEQQLAASDKTLPGWLLTYAADEQPGGYGVYERAGLSVARYFLELGRDLAAPVDDVPVDGDIRVVQFSPDLSRSTQAALNDSFRDHWGSQPMTDEQWDTFVGRSVMRPELSSLAIATAADGTDVVAGLVMTSVNEEDWPGQGFSSAYIDLVGVAREWRKRGIASALLANTLRAVAAARLDKAVLDVDAENPSGALGLYTALGFAESHRTLAYRRVY